jgi:hypothetical protein
LSGEKNAPYVEIKKYKKIEESKTGLESVNHLGTVKSP